MAYDTIEYTTPNYQRIYEELKETLEATKESSVALDLTRYPALGGRAVKVEMLKKGIVLSKVNRKPIIVCSFNTE